MIDTIKYFKSLAQKTINDCFIKKETWFKGSLEEQRIFLPAGDEKYKSFWPVDAIFSSRCGLMSSEELKDIIDIIFNFGQNGNQVLKLENGLKVPPYAIADHINFDAKPVYFPGTYSSSANQGDGSYGFLPPLNNLYLVSELVDRYISTSGDSAILNKEYNGTPLKECLENAFNASYAVDQKTGLCCGNAQNHTVDWTYCDQVKKSGLFLVPSIMRAQAAGILSKFFPEKKNYYLNLQTKIINAICELLFDSKTGWFYSATEIGHQHDVWGTAYAVYSELFPKDINQKASEAILRAYKDGTAVSGGYVRHIKTDEEFSENSCWECCFSKYNRYMDGGYWATPSGWFYYALAQTSENSANEFLEEFKKFNQQNLLDGAPYEWFHPETKEREGRKYGTSGTSIYAALKKINNF